MHSKNTICIAHGNCTDGFTAAWVVKKALDLPTENIHHGVYQEPPLWDLIDKDIIFVDFSYKRQVTESIIKEAKSVTILDHHISAIKDLEGLDGLNTVFDINRSGARIAWDYFFPNETPPKLLLHVEDRDLWRFNIPYTEEIQANLFSHEYNFDTWDLLMSTDPNTLINDGIAIARKQTKDINELLKIVTRYMNIGGHLVPVANLPYTYSSEAGHILGKDAPFAGCYWDTPDKRIFSLRSSETGVDVSEIAKQYGGGGHAHAAGFAVTFKQAQEFDQ